MTDGAAEIPGIQAPQEWTPEQVAEFERAWDEHWARNPHPRAVVAAEAKTLPGCGTFELTCDGPGWKALPVVNGHVVAVASADVHVDAESFPEVTLRFPAADAVRLGFSPAVIGVDGESRAALVSLGWTPPAEPSCPCGAAHPQGYECAIGPVPPEPASDEEIAAAAAAKAAAGSMPPVV